MPALPRSLPSLPAAKTLLLRLKFEVRTQLSRHPAATALFRPYIWWTQYKMRGIINPEECRVQRDTEFVLDGFQGSGNSFATVAFKSCQTSPVQLAHHLHSPAQIIQAARWKIPTLVTIRDPRDAVISLISRWPYVTLRQGLRAYTGFYQSILPYVNDLVISPFDMTTQHLNVVFTEVNRRFSVSFDVFEHTPEQVRRVRSKTFLPPIAEQERQALKEELAAKLTETRYKPLLEQATRVYEAIQNHVAWNAAMVASTVPKQPGVPS